MGIFAQLARFARVALAIIVAANIVGGGGAVRADPTTDAAKADGKAFGAATNNQVIGAAHRQPTADTVPNYTANPSQTSYYSSPTSLSSSAAALAPGSAGYRQVTTSMTARPQIPVSQVKDTIARGKLVANDPATYTSGFGASGTQGSCHPLPPTASSGGTYEQACNKGFVSGTTNPSCSVVVNH